MSIQWNKVTWYSKLLAVILFVAVFGVGILLGMQIQLDKDTNTYNQRYEAYGLNYHPHRSHIAMHSTTSNTTKPVLKKE